MLQFNVKLTVSSGTKPLCGCTSDGELIDVDVLIGADGIDSLVRRTLWATVPSENTTDRDRGDLDR